MGGRDGGRSLPRGAPVGDPRLAIVRPGMQPALETEVVDYGPNPAWPQSSDIRRQRLRWTGNRRFVI